MQQDPNSIKNSFFCLYLFAQVVVGGDGGADKVNGHQAGDEGGTDAIAENLCTTGKILIIKLKKYDLNWQDARS